jgi:hypothetical protein
VRLLLAKAIAGRRLRRRYTFALAFVAAAVLTGAAYSVARELLVGDPPPPEVVSHLARFGHEADLIQHPRPDDPIVGEARVAAVLESSVGRAYLFSVPNGLGHQCGWVWVEGERGHQGRPNTSSVCGTASETFWALSRQQIKEQTVRLFSGRAGDGVAQVEVRFSDRTLQIPLTGRWFFAEFSRDPLEVRSLDRAGGVVSRHPVLRPFARGKPTPRSHQIGAAEMVLALNANGGSERITLEVAEASLNNSCMIVRSDKRPTNRGCGVPTPAPREIGVVAMQFGGAPGGVQLLVGPVGTEIANLRVEYQDGRLEEIPLNKHWALYEVVPADYAEGRRPVELIASGESGHVIARERLPWG